MEIILIATICIIFLGYLAYKSYIRLNYYKYEKELLQYLDEAYSIVYIEDLNIYITSNSVITSDDAEYVALLKKLKNVFITRVGSKQYKFFVKLLGSEQDLIDYMNLYFTQKLYDDVVRTVLEKIPMEARNKNNKYMINSVEGDNYEVNNTGLQGS